MSLLSTCSHKSNLVCFCACKCTYLCFWQLLVIVVRITASGCWNQEQLKWVMLRIWHWRLDGIRSLSQFTSNRESWISDGKMTFTSTLGGHVGRCVFSASQTIARWMIALFFSYVRCTSPIVQMHALPRGHVEFERQIRLPYVFLIVFVPGSYIRAKVVDPANMQCLD